jgi:penicillin-binding protein 1A
MTGPLKAGEPLTGRRGGTPGQPPKTAPGKRRAKLPYKAGLLVRISRALFGAILGLTLLVGVAGGVGAWVAYNHYSAGLPDVDGLRSYQPPVMSRIYAGDSHLLAELAAERRIFVPVTAIPPMVKQAFISAEDHNFYQHGGVDPMAIGRAALFDLMHAGQGRRPIGASTITQQVAKNMLLDSEVSLSRKVKEAILATRIEETLSKDRILELYMNEIYLGLGSYGVAAAAQAYFNKSLDSLTVSEAAFLAALPKAPNNLNPFKYPDAARSRRDYVVDRLLEDHAITAAQAVEAKSQPVVPAEFRRPPPVPGADWFTEDVRRELVARFGQDTTTQGGLVVRTSLSPRLQSIAEKSLRDGLMTYDRRLGGWRGPVTHTDVTAAEFASRWASVLGGTARPPGMLANWSLAIVGPVEESTAQVGMIEPNGEHRRGVIQLADTTWARPIRENKPGPAPHRMSEVVHTGDIVMVEPVAQSSPPLNQPQTARARAAVAGAASGRVLLRQIPLVQGAMVSLDPHTGRVLAMVGGWSYEQSQFNRASQAQRQPGSSFKPIVYLTALERGIPPSQRFLDGPIVINTPEGRWRPGNYEGTFGGPTSLRVALEQSLNLVTLRVAQKVGMRAVADNAIAFGMVDKMPRVLPAALGAVDTTVLREAGVYASFAESGRLVKPTLIDSVQDSDGHVVMRRQGLDCQNCSDPNAMPSVTDSRQQVADPDSVCQLVTMMQGVMQRGTGAPVGKGLNRPVAGKTGTTQDFVDAWFSGFTPDMVTVVWVGFDNPASLGDDQSGANVAGPIWHDYMEKVMAGRPPLAFPVPPGITMAQWDSGRGTVTDAFKEGQVPGATASLGAGVSSSSGDEVLSGSSPVAHSGIDSSLGGLY